MSQETVRKGGSTNGNAASEERMQKVVVEFSRELDAKIKPYDCGTYG